MIILSHGGDYLLGLKDNQPTLHQLAQSKLAAVLDEWCSDWEKDHGRIERRRIARVDLDQDIIPYRINKVTLQVQPDSRGHGKNHAPTGQARCGRHH